MTANNLPPRLYYRLDEAAQLLGCTESDLIHRGAMGEIDLHCLVPQRFANAKVVKNWHRRRLITDASATVEAASFDFVETATGLLGAAISGLFIIDSDSLKQIEKAGKAGPVVTLLGAVDELKADELGHWLSEDEDGAPLHVDDDGWAALELTADFTISRDAVLVSSSTLSTLKREREPVGAPAAQGAGYAKQVGTPRGPSPKRLNAQWKFAELLSSLLGANFSRDDTTNPMAIIIDILSAREYAPLLHSPYELHTALDYLATRNGRSLCISDEALARWIKAHTQHSQHSQHSPYVGHGIKKP